jgi:anti-sigma factor RsiW
MNCDDVRSRLDLRLPEAPPEPALERHLAHCPGCAAHAAALASLDARLGALFGRLDAPADFDARLAARIAREPTHAAPDRAALETAFDASRRRLRRETLGETLALGGAGVTIGALAWDWGPALGSRLAEALAHGGLPAVSLLSVLGAAGALWAALVHVLGPGARLR